MDKEIVLITGGSRGIGEAIVRRVARSGRIVLFTYHTAKDAAEKISAALTTAGCENHIYQLDVGNPHDVERVVTVIGETFGDIDILVNNAGIIRDNPLYMISDEEWHDVINTNLSGVFYMCRAVSKYMIRRRRGKIITISSVTASKGARGQANYAAAKGGVESLTRSLAIELSPKNITVNCVSPGVIETEMTETIRHAYHDIILSKICMKRIGKPEEVAGVVNFLMSDEASYINGQVIHVDGGML
jgi:3-oxoacyl-[acyl-carrier protein] reductase